MWIIKLHNFLWNILFLGGVKRDVFKKQIKEKHLSNIKCRKHINYPEIIFLLEDHLLLTYLNHFFEQKERKLTEFIQVFDI